jgi:hypothetical protein
VKAIPSGDGKAGATIGELINIDEVFKTAFAYQSKALEGD